MLENADETRDRTSARRSGGRAAASGSRAREVQKQHQPTRTHMRARPDDAPDLSRAVGQTAVRAARRVVLGRAGRPPGRRRATRSAPSTAVQPKARTASNPLIGPAGDVNDAFDRLAQPLSRPVAPWRWPVSTSSPPTTVFVKTSARLTADVTSMNGKYAGGHDRRTPARTGPPGRRPQHVAAAAGTEQRVRVADQPDQRLAVPGDGRDCPEGRHAVGG